MNNLGNIFNSISEHLGQTEKHFKGIELTNYSYKLNESTLNDTSFADILFDDFYAYGIMRINHFAFGKSAETIDHFWCSMCYLNDSPQEYNIWSVLNKFTNLNTLTLGLNVTEIPSNAIQPINGQQSNITDFTLRSMQSLTIKTNAFNNFRNLNQLMIQLTNINQIEKSGLNFVGESNSVLNLNGESNSLFLIFASVKFSDDSFAPDSFGDLQRPLNILFISRNITHIPESSFKTVLKNNESKIKFDNSLIDCFDCRNQWLITTKKQKQIDSPFCKHNTKMLLFHLEIQLNLIAKCQ